MVYIHSWADKRPNTITTKADSNKKKPTETQTILIIQRF